MLVTYPYIFYNPYSYIENSVFWLLGCQNYFFMLEKTVENHLCKEVKKLGGLCIKWVSPSMDSLPDRQALYQGGIIDLIETKKPGKIPRKKQLIVHGMLRALGFRVYVLDTKPKVDDYIKKRKLIL